MPRMQNPYLSASGTNGGGFDWSSEISGQPGFQDLPQQSGQITNIQVNQHQQNNHTSSPAPIQPFPGGQTGGQAAGGQTGGQTGGQVNGGQTGGQTGGQANGGQTGGQTGGQAAGGQTNGQTNGTSMGQASGMANPSDSMAVSFPAASQGTIPTLRPQGSPTVLDLRHHMTQEQIESPTTVDEAHMGSMKAVMGRNLGNFVVATFLVGTQGTTSWEGLLYEVGNDYLIIYQTGRDRYIVCDIYSLKYIEFYDTRRQEMCENIMLNQGWQNNGWQENG